MGQQQSADAEASDILRPLPQVRRNPEILTMVEHRLSQEPQPIADQVMVKCSCGWREAVTVWGRTQVGMMNEIKRVGEAHLEKMQ